MCAVVCVRLMSSVPCALPIVLCDDLWRFSTSTRVWRRVDDTTTDGTRPSARSFFVMVSVGLDLWVHGGLTQTGEGEQSPKPVVLVLLR
jgi:hypothetical protein